MMDFPAQQACPLCYGEDVRAFFHDRQRQYVRCQTCALIFVPPVYFLTPDAEKAEYDLHQNSPDDAGYRTFLQRLFEPLHARLAPGGQGLDFGSGPGPTLSVMFEEAGHTMTLYDVFYADEPDAFNRPYDFITATEVIEHLRQPRKDLERLWGCLKPGGILGIMTKLAKDREAFSRWHYIRDMTHISFFSVTTIQWLADHWQATLTWVATDAFLLQKPEISST
jgi:SAM-dependent methyltransferase